MKKFDLPSIAINGAISICMGVASAGCLVTAFGMEASLVEALLSCILWAALTCVALQWRRGWIVTVAGLLLWWQLLWVLQAHDEFGSLLRILFDVYSRGYGIVIPEKLLEYAPGDLSLAISAIAGTVTLLAGLSLTKLRSGVLAITFSALPVVPCFLVTDTVPHEFFLFLLFVCGGVILLSHGIRQKNPRQATRLTAMLLLPVMLCSILLFQTNPRQEFDKQPEKVIDYIVNNWIVPLLPTVDPVMPTFTFSPSITIDPDLPDITLPQVDLRFVGPKRNSKTPVMTVMSEGITGTVYLREKSYNLYDGHAWSIGPLDDDSLEILDPSYLDLHWSDYEVPWLKIQTVKAHKNMYVPYYSTELRLPLQDGAYPNPNSDRAYSMPVLPLKHNWQSLYRNSYPQMPLSALRTMDLPAGFTSLPQQTNVRAQEFLKGYGISDSSIHVLDVANVISHIVYASAEYDLQTGFMPAGETDFALWFLENSDTGYCIHFASAAVVLLRAAGIPARYVEGYTAQLDAYGEALVTQAQAHAWVEYWVPKLGWVIMDPTPADKSAPPVTTTPTEPTTRPTAPTTEPTVPTTRPTEPTEPTPPTTKPTNPTEPTPPTTTPTSPTDPTAPTTTPTSPTDPTAPTTSTAPTTQTTQPPSVPPTTSPDTQDPERPKADLTWLWIMLQSLLVLLLAAGALIGQWWLRLYLRKKWLCHGSSNAQALRRWRYAKRMARLRRQDAPAALKELALKARFSQHTISDEELAAFDGYFARSVAHLKSRPIWLRLVYRLVFAAY